jgi:hypothetical protein
MIVCYHVSSLAQCKLAMSATSWSRKAALLKWGSGQFAHDSVLSC